MAENPVVLPEQCVDGQDCDKPDGKLKLTIDKLSEFEREVGGQRLSDPVMIRGLPWKILALRREKPDPGKIKISCLGFYLQCNSENTDPSWRCAAKAEMKVLAQKGGKVAHVRTVEHVFCAEANDWGFSQFMSFESLKDPASGWYDEHADSIVLAIDVVADEPHGMDASTFVSNYAIIKEDHEGPRECMFWPRIKEDHEKGEYLAKGSVELVVPKEGNAHKTSNNIGGFEWELCVKKAADRGGMYVLAIACRPCHPDHLWLCRAKYAIEKKCVMFTGDSYGQNCHHIDLSSEVAMFPLDVKVELTIYTGLPDIMPLDTNIEVKCDGKSETVPVNKHGLAAVSSYFRNLFFVQWREQGAEQFVIHENEHHISAFKFMLGAALSTGMSLNEFSLSETQHIELLKLSVKYDIPMLVKQCEMRLIKASSSSDSSYFKMLELADAFSLPQLKAHCLARVGLTEFGDNFTANVALSARLSKRTRDELDERLRECAKKMRLTEQQGGTTSGTSGSE